MDAPLGPEIDWTPAAAVEPRELRGAYVKLRPVAAGDAGALFEAGRDPAIWTYLPYGPFPCFEDFSISSRTSWTRK